MKFGFFQDKHSPSAATPSWASSLSRHSTKPAINFLLTACSLQNSFVMFKATPINCITDRQCEVSYLIMCEVSNQSGLDVWVACNTAQNLGTLESSIRVRTAVVQIPVKAKKVKSAHVLLNQTNPKAFLTWSGGKWFWWEQYMADICINEESRPGNVGDVISTFALSTDTLQELFHWRDK